MVFHWSLNDSKSPQVSRTRLSILAVLSNAVVWIVSTRPPTSKSSRLFNNPLVTVPNAPITIGTIVTFLFHSFFFNSLARSRYLSFFSLSFRFILWSAGTAKSTILQILFLLLIIMRSGLLAGIIIVLFASFQQISSGLQNSPQNSRRPQQCWWPRLVLRFPTPPALLPSLLESFQAHQLQLVSLSPSYSIAFFHFSGKV